MNNIFQTPISGSTMLPSEPEIEAKQAATVEREKAEHSLPVAKSCGQNSKRKWRSDEYANVFVSLLAREFWIHRFYVASVRS
ncbi:MAG: hypothetical protein R3F31_13565 [Verrucomicrobiales bacterium]